MALITIQNLQRHRRYEDVFHQTEIHSKVYIALNLGTKYSFYHLDQTTNVLSLWENCNDSNCNSECIFKHSQSLDDITTDRCSEFYVEKVWSLDTWDNQLVHDLHVECPGIIFGTRQVT